MTHTSKDEDCALNVPCSQVVQLARVGVHVIVVDVVCVMLVLIARVVVHAVSTQFSYPFSVVGDVLFTFFGFLDLGWFSQQLFFWSSRRKRVSPCFPFDTFT